uniref:S-formylglutathione hydrolase n=1 Tax=Syphacia muris TaxID=451379 RepID=A0A0N5ASY4_9BILA
MESNLKEISSTRWFNGVQKVFAHQSNELKCTVNFGVYLPDLKEGEKAPVLLFLSGLTCTEDNFIRKSGFQRYASELKIIVVNTDTSPRGDDVDDEPDSYDVGKGAGFYVDALTPKWNRHYRMYSYITKEIPRLFEQHFPQCDKDRWGIFGHSMGGLGAIVIGLRNPQIFKSISAFAPLCNPMKSPWGQKAFSIYLGSDENEWKSYDSVEVIKSYSGPERKLLIDQGTQDEFLNEQLMPITLEPLSSNKVHIILRYQEGYDHSYAFISTFIEDHFKFHSEALTSTR